ncbi:hypothetical protein ADUPG1_008468 [Aduncisulcus paluster]|uniref:RING-type domain-containing protein n=1 Tax=Aduncisulcus paluster TaxID=2918883 RepID=A0ABQ5KUG7_9EUKA|nr:hypothetical protein ADUPG1_008468 [Aduncisulcus paluster]
MDRFRSFFELDSVEPSQQHILQPLHCGICFSIVFPDPVRLKCGHVFHQACIEPWIATHRTCPTCKSPIQPGEYYIDRLALYLLSHARFRCRVPLCSFMGTIDESFIHIQTQHLWDEIRPFIDFESESMACNILEESSHPTSPSRSDRPLTPIDDGESSKSSENDDRRSVSGMSFEHSHSCASCPELFARGEDPGPPPKESSSVNPSASTILGPFVQNNPQFSSPISSIQPSPIQYLLAEKSTDDELHCSEFIISDETTWMDGDGGPVLTSISPHLGEIITFPANPSSNPFSNPDFPSSVNDGQDGISTNGDDIHSYFGEFPSFAAAGRRFCEEHGIEESSMWRIDSGVNKASEEICDFSRHDFDPIQTNLSASEEQSQISERDLFSSDYDVCILPFSALRRSSKGGLSTSTQDEVDHGSGGIDSSTVPFHCVSSDSREMSPPLKRNPHCISQPPNDHGSMNESFVSLSASHNSDSYEYDAHPRVDVAGSIQLSKDFPIICSEYESHSERSSSHSHTMGSHSPCNPPSHPGGSVSTSSRSIDDHSGSVNNPKGQSGNPEDK